MAAIPVPRFDQFYRHPELTRLPQDYAAALPGLAALHLQPIKHQHTKKKTLSPSPPSQFSLHRDARVLVEPEGEVRAQLQRALSAVESRLAWSKRAFSWASRPNACTSVSAKTSGVMWPMKPSATMI